MLYHTLNIVNLRIRTVGRQRKEDGKRCVTSVTIKMFKKRFRQTSPSSEQIFCKPKYSHVKYISHQNKQVTALSQKNVLASSSFSRLVA